jgi:hypothetical protein
MNIDAALKLYKQNSSRESERLKPLVFIDDGQVKIYTKRPILGSSMKCVLCLQVGTLYNHTRLCEKHREIAKTKQITKIDNSVVIEWGDVMWYNTAAFQNMPSDTITISDVGTTIIEDNKFTLDSIIHATTIFKKCNLDRLKHVRYERMETECNTCANVLKRAFLLDYIMRLRILYEWREYMDVDCMRVIRAHLLYTYFNKHYGIRDEWIIKYMKHT